MDKFWVALKEAEKGDATELKSLLGELRDAALNKAEAGKELDQGDESNDDGSGAEGGVAESESGAGSGP